LQALEESGIVVDHIGGTSMGAIIGGAYAAGYPTHELCSLVHRWHSSGAMRDLSFPTVSFLDSKKTERVFKELFGDRDIEDFWKNFLCVTVDITQGAVAVHERGEAAAWIRASGAVPGVFPPVIGPNGHLHIDGGLMNNVPSDIMKARWKSRVIAVDVGSPNPSMVYEPTQRPAIGLRYVADRMRNRPTLPSVGETLQRGALLTSTHQREAAIAAADVFLEPDVTEFGLFDFAKFKAVARRGYECAQRNMDNIVKALS
jgi:NTE family protein